MITEVFCREIAVHIWALVEFMVPKALLGCFIEWKGICHMRLKEPCGYYKVGKNKQVYY